MTSAVARGRHPRRTHSTHGAAHRRRGGAPDPPPAFPSYERARGEDDPSSCRRVVIDFTLLLPGPRQPGAQSSWTARRSSTKAAGLVLVLLFVRTAPTTPCLELRGACTPFGSKPPAAATWAPARPARVRRHPFIANGPSATARAGRTRRQRIHRRMPFTSATTQKRAGGTPFRRRGGKGLSSHVGTHRRGSPPWARGALSSSRFPPFPS